MWRKGIDRLAGGRVRPFLTLGLLVAAVFGPVLGFDFVRWDDPVNVTHNPLLTEPWSRDLLARLVNGDTALRFKPLTWLLYRGTHATAGFNPAAWHALNLALHLSAAGLFCLVLRDLLARFRPEAPRAARQLLAWLGAAAWAVHPAHAEAACWVTATPYPLMVGFLLGSFRSYLRATDPAAGGGAARRHFLVAWLLALAAYASYPVGVTYGLWLMAADLWILRIAPRGADARRELGPWLGRHALFLLPAVASVLVTWKSSGATPWLYPAPATLLEVGVAVRLQMAAAMLGSVWTHFVWPFGLTPNNPMLPPEMVGGPMILGMAGATLGLLLAAALAAGRRPAFTGVVLGSALLALPVLGLAQWPSWAVADRHVYLPHLVLTAALVLLAARAAARRWFALLVAAAFALVAGLALLGWRQGQIWRDTDTLFTYLEKQPAFAWNPGQQAYIYKLWGTHLAEQGRSDQARGKMDRARRVLVEGVLAAAGRGQWAEAVELSRELELSFGLPPALRRERVRWLTLLGRTAEAQTDRALLPGDPPPH